VATRWPCCGASRSWRRLAQLNGHRKAREAAGADAGPARRAEEAPQALRHPCQRGDHRSDGALGDWASPPRTRSGLAELGIAAVGHVVPGPDGRPSCGPSGQARENCSSRAALQDRGRWSARGRPRRDTGQREPREYDLDVIESLAKAAAGVGRRPGRRGDRRTRADGIGPLPGFPCSPRRSRHTWVLAQQQRRGGWSRWPRSLLRRRGHEIPDDVRHALVDRVAGQGLAGVEQPGPADRRDGGPPARSRPPTSSPPPRLPLNRGGGTRVGRMSTNRPLTTPDSYGRAHMSTGFAEQMEEAVAQYQRRAHGAGRVPARRAAEVSATVTAPPQGRHRDDRQCRRRQGDHVSDDGIQETCPGPELAKGARADDRGRAFPRPWTRSPTCWRRCFRLGLDPASGRARQHRSGHRGCRRIPPTSTGMNTSEPAPQ